MGAQSINTNTVETLFEEVQQTIKGNTKKLLFQERFALGDGMCEVSQRHALKLYEIISKDNCILNDYLLKIIKSGPDCDFVADVNLIGDDNNSQPAEDLYQIWLMRGNKGSYDDFLDMLFNVNVDVWSDVEW